MLLVQEAGGVVTDLAGRPYRPGAWEMFASNGRIHGEVREVAARVAEHVSRDAGR
jgi:fructose-1,6-bisphosphatase/inositol monophosphatase family enzyme